MDFLLLLETFWTNPQYQFEVIDPDDDDDEDAGTVILALMQKERRKKRKEGLDVLTIGYAIYKVSCCVDYPNNSCPANQFIVATMMMMTKMTTMITMTMMMMTMIMTNYLS